MGRLFDGVILITMLWLNEVDENEVILFR